MGGIDRISTLPDVLLCHILSYVPSKTAVATSVLSNRWRNIWHSVPAIDLDDSLYLHIGDYHPFANVAYALMLRLHATQPILTFRLKCQSSLSCFPWDLNLWIDTAIQHCVETMELSLPLTAKLPSTALTSTKLVSLTLRGLTVDNVRSVSLPALKFLHLIDEVRFTESRYLEMLLSGCPILEDLRIGQLEVWFSQPPFVTEFNLPNLVKADVMSVWIPIAKFYNVNFLSICVAEFPTTPECTFHNLIRMQLLVTRSCKWHLLVGLLKYCPKLQFLSVVVNATVTSTIASEFVYSSKLFIPQCVSMRLSECVLEGLWSSQDIQFASYVMLTARVLRRMVIRSASFLNIDTKFKMLRYLSLVSRSSTSCSLIFA
ncbi:hypothetical protein HN51_067303 [Arachis hypogaea]|uniref:F-box/FBD/LRR-repeat protein At4g26340-like n=1 Tax=Arachis ipaensis TaxID=130454 RepID=UPI000A2B26CF|nr:F-box/FBD/LRR-repeat protein At4g26340-like [Arachis ipaensis]XP_025645037.1 F-box/FBD/LRR-repeat protein At4g26340-like [Arachis hypogaea]QHO08700.1 F-box/FBD/LRR-repeat protein [Arachis hypogaea]